MLGSEPAYYSSMKVFYASKKLLGRERNYPVGERKALAIVWAVQNMHRFLTFYTVSISS